MRQALIWLALLAVATALLAGWALGDRDAGPQDYAAAEALRAREERAADWYAASRPIRLALLAVAGGVAVAGVGGLLWAWILHLQRRARTFYADENGILPAVLLKEGETVADLSSLAGPLTLGPQGPAYPALPQTAATDLQRTALQGAALTRSTRAWATHQPGSKEPAALPWPAAPAGADYPPVEVLEGDEAHILRLLEGNDA